MVALASDANRVSLVLQRSLESLISYTISQLLHKDSPSQVFAAKRLVQVAALYRMYNAADELRSKFWPLILEELASRDSSDRTPLAILTMQEVGKTFGFSNEPPDSSLIDIVSKRDAVKVPLNSGTMQEAMGLLQGSCRSLSQGCSGRKTQTTLESSKIVAALACASMELNDEQFDHFLAIVLVKINEVIFAIFVNSRYITGFFINCRAEEFVMTRPLRLQLIFFALIGRSGLAL